jgi:hypothetical protein
MAGPEFITAIEAKTALETPQILLSWAFDGSVVSPLNNVVWPWDNLELRRSQYRFPEDETDEDNILTEAYSSNPTTVLSDITTAAFLEYYYSLFLQYTEHSSSLIGINHDVKRLGAQLSAVISEDPPVFYGGVDGSTVATAVFTSANSAFLSNGVEAGFILEIIEGGADDGFYRIVSVDSETQVTLDSSVSLTTSAIDFLVYTDQRKYWIAGVDYYRKATLWRRDSEAQVVDYKIDLSELLDLDEFVTSASYSGVRTTAGSDGVTLSSNTRTFISTGSTFETDGIRAGDIIVINDAGTPGDNRLYFIETVDSEVQLKIGEDWPTGDLSSLTFTIYYNHVSFITRDRYIRIPIMEQPESDNVILEWELLASGLTPGFKVTGSFLDRSVFEASETMFVLDAVNQEIVKLAESDGTLASAIDLTALDEVADGTLQGLAADVVDNEILIGNRNYIYSLDENVGASPTVADVDKITYARQALRADIGWYENPLTNELFVLVVDDDIDKLQTYKKEIGRGYLWQQPFVVDANTIGLWHLDETAGVPADASQYANNGVNNGMDYEGIGQFGTGLEATGVTDNIDVIAVSGEWNGAEGSVLVWFKAASISTLTSGTSVLFDARADANNLVRIGIDSGNLTFEYIAASTAETIQAVHPNPDTEYHAYKITWSAANDEVKAFVDGVQFGSTQTGLGVWAGALATATIGDTAAAALGVYDEVRISDIARTVHPSVQLYTSANRMYAFSGRDYTAEYNNNDPLGFYYRDEFFTDKYFGGGYLLRNDYEREQLHPPDKIIESNQEVVFRGPSPLPVLGDMGRTARIFGLFMDRLADDRERHMNFFSPEKIDYDDIEEHAEWLGLPGLDTENWNVDKQRRFLKVMPFILKRGGLVSSYVDYARFLGFISIADTLISKRRFDSVLYSAVDPYTQAIPFDTMGSFDTWHWSFPLALLRFRFYRRSFRSVVGATSVPANRLFTDAGASFRDTLQVGSLIQINDQSTVGDNGNYLVVEIHSDTVVKVDQDWPVGSLSNLVYTGNWEVPQPDPDSDFLLESFLNIGPDAMSVVHRDESV